MVPVTNENVGPCRPQVSTTWVSHGSDGFEA